MQAHSNDITNTIDETRDVYQTDSCFRQRRIIGFDSEVVGIWVIGYAERTPTTEEQTGLDVWRLFEWSGTPRRRDLEDVERGRVRQSLRRTKVKVRLRPERVHLVVLQDGLGRKPTGWGEVLSRISSREGRVGMTPPAGDEGVLQHRKG